MFYFYNLLQKFNSRLERNEKGQWNMNNPIGLLITVIIVIILIVVLFKVLDRV